MDFKRIHEVKFYYDSDTDLLFDFSSHITHGLEILKNKQFGRQDRSIDIICSMAAYSFISAYIPFPKDKIYKPQSQSFDEMIKNLAVEDENGLWDFGKRGENSEYNMKLNPKQYGYSVMLLAHEMWGEQELPKKYINITAVKLEPEGSNIEDDEDDN